MLIAEAIAHALRTGATRSYGSVFVDPGFDVDLYMARDLRTMTEVWTPYTPEREGRSSITGNRELEFNLKSWLTLSPFAKVEKIAASLGLPE